VFLGILGITIITNGYLMAVDWYRPLFVSWTPDTGGQKSHVGQLNGWGWLMDDPYNSSVFQVLSSWPEGTVLESSYLNPADSRAGLGLFTGHFQALAWSQHESILRGNRPDLDRLKDLRDDFYMGHASDISWLNSCVPGGVTYIIWDSRDNDRTLVAWPVINEQLKGKYDWKECQKYSMAEWGFWVRRPVAGEQP
jgi:hypothetical protein